MKRIITSALVILMTIGAAQAQSGSKEKHKTHKEHRKGGFDGLNLSADQQARMKALREDYKKQASGLKANTQLSEADKKTRRQELHKQHRAQVEAILTPAQKQALAEKNSEWKAAGKEGKKDAKRGSGKFTKGRKGGEGRSARLEKELNLTTDQQAKVKRIRADFKSKAAALRNDNTRTKEQKRSELKDLGKQQREQLKSVMTSQQIEKMQTLKKERAARNTK